MIAYKNINLLLLSSFIFKTKEEHTETLMQYLKGLNYCINPYFFNEICKKANEHFCHSYNDVIIYYFTECMNSLQWGRDWDYINWTYQNILSQNLPDFTYDQMCTLLKYIRNFDTQATCFKTMANQIVSISKEKGYDINFKDYDVDISAYL